MTGVPTPININYVPEACFDSRWSNKRVSKSDYKRETKGRKYRLLWLFYVFYGSTVYRITIRELKPFKDKITFVADQNHFYDVWN